MQASPSKARAQALESHAWSLVTSWLSELYHPFPTPAFERNAATLRALQSLMAESTAADKLRRLLYDAQCEELEAAKKAEAEAEARLGGARDDGLGLEGGRAREELLKALQSSLSHPASEALDSLASSAVLLGCSTTTSTAASIGQVLRSEILRLSQETFALESRIRSLDEQVSRFQTTQPPLQGQEQDREREQAQQRPHRRHLIPASTTTEASSSSTPTRPQNQSYNYFEPPDDLNPPSTSTPSASAFDTTDNPPFLLPDTSTLHAQTQHHQRETKQLQLKAQEYKDRIAAHLLTHQQDADANANANTNANTNANPAVSVTTTHVAAKHRLLEKQADEIKALETAVRAFHGLPPDVEASREEVRRATGELESLRRKRDGWFEKLGE